MSRVGPINSEIIYKRDRRAPNPDRMMPKAGKLGAMCDKGKHPWCYVLSCSCECHRRQA